MVGFLINSIKIVFLLGFLILIHESGHFIIAKLCKIRVNQFSIGFGPILWQRQGKETIYQLRLIPLGGFVSMEGEEEPSENEGSFSNASIPKRMAIIVAGASVNIIFGILLYFFLVLNMVGFNDAISNTLSFLSSIFENLKNLFTHGINPNELMGVVGISNVVANTSSFQNYLYILSLISLSLGITNLLPFPPLDGWKFVVLLLEAIRKKPLKEKTEATIQTVGFYILIGLSIYVMFNDFTRIF